MLETYETSVMTEEQANRFIELFIEAIGTDTEINGSDDEFYVVCFELEADEIDECMALESDVLGRLY